MIIDYINNYFASNLYKPFFAAVGDEEYKSIMDIIKLDDAVKIYRVSDYCFDEDKKPNLDKLKSDLRIVDVSCKSNKIIVLGLGEYLALEGNIYAVKMLSELKDINLGSAHAVFLLRGVYKQLKDLAEQDPRMLSRPQLCFGENLLFSLSLKLSPLELSLFDNYGLKSVISFFEKGDCKNIEANSDVKFLEPLYDIETIRNSHEIIIKKIPNFLVPQFYGNEVFWSKLLIDLKNCNYDLDLLFESHNFDIYDMNTFYTRLYSDEYNGWLYFIYLFVFNKSKKINNIYLSYVLDNCKSFDSFKYAVLNTITDISRNNKIFEDLYNGRKKLVSSYPDSEISSFVLNNRVDYSESVYKLTDNTIVEKEEILTYVSREGIPKDISNIYCDFSYYMDKFTFNTKTLDDLLTDYFQEYKMQKVLNTLEEDFLERVDELALKRVYNRLRSRNEIIQELETYSTYLYWVDALGVEYLSYIKNLAIKKGLCFSVEIGRADLPTITSINKSFFDNWSGDKFKESELDEIKHKDTSKYSFDLDKKPIHLAKELDIIKKVIETAATDLALKKHKKFVIASDHGASRLAVLRQKEEKYDTDTQGKHSGRCCAEFEGCNLPFATKENGYIVLADYGRFKGSRAANVEVHGGASLEEVVVPVITLSLIDSNISIKVVEETIKADVKNGIEFTLFSDTLLNNNLFVMLNGLEYICDRKDDYHYAIKVPEIKRAGKYQVEVYIDNNLNCSLEINVKSKSASFDSDFDDLF